MTPFTKRIFFVGWTILSLFLGGLLTYLFFSRRPLTLHQITVFGSPPAVNPPTEYIAARTNDIVNWTATSGTIAIEFRAENFPNPLREPPFAGGMSGVNQSMNCFQSSCTSLNINPKVVAYLNTHQTEKLEYKYWQALNGVWADGKIIIKW
jgi:hypothetical protein